MGHGLFIWRSQSYDIVSWEDVESATLELVITAHIFTK